MDPYRQAANIPEISADDVHKRYRELSRQIEALGGEIGARRERVRDITALAKEILIHKNVSVDEAFVRATLFFGGADNVAEDHEKSSSPDRDRLERMYEDKIALRKKYPNILKNAW